MAGSSSLIATAAIASSVATSPQAASTTAGSVPYATGPALMYYGSGFIGKGDFWKFGLIFGLIYFAGLLVIVLPWLQWIG